MPLINVGGKQYHASLTDREGTVVGLNLVDARGNDNATEISQSNHPRTPLQTSTGQGEYSDLLLPYKELVQGDWSGGRALLNARKDQTRYLDSGGLDSELPEQVILRGRPTYTTGLHTCTQSLPALTTWQAMNGDGLFRSVSFTVSANIAQDNVYIMLWVRRMAGETQDLHVAICPDLAGEPNIAGSLGSGNFRAVDVEAGISEILVTFKCINPGGLVAGTTYHLVPWVIADGYNSWEILSHGSSGGGLESDTGLPTEWNVSFSPCFRVYDGSNAKSGEYFEYKSALYYIEYPGSGNSRILINGDRGAADSNAGALTTLVDATKAWATDEFIGGVVLLTAGPGSKEITPWRMIVSNSATALTVSPPWVTDHTVSTEYVILETNVWKVHVTLAYTVRDVEVAGEYIYFTDHYSALNHCIERNVAGVWTKTTGNDLYIEADILKAIQHPTDGMVLWGGTNGHRLYGTSVFYGRVPRLYGEGGALHKYIGELDAVDRLWDEQPVSTITQSHDRGSLQLSVAAGHVTGILASRRLPVPVDITQATSLQFGIKSTIAVTAGALNFLVDDTYYCGKKYIPNFLYHYNTEGYAKLVLYDDSETTASKWKTQGNTERRRDGTAIYVAGFTLAADDRIYVGFGQRFDRLKWVISTAQTNSQTLTCEYWDGQAWAAVTSFTDGTVATGKTLAQSGDMTFTISLDWNPGTHGDQATYLEQSNYWIRLIPSAALTIAKGELTVEDGQVIEYVSLTRAKDGDTGTFDVVTLTTDDYLYVGAEFRFERLDINVGVVNAVAATLSAQYFNGATWETLSLASDGTAAGGATLAKDGTVVINIQNFDWHKCAIENNEAYWLRLAVSADLTPNITLIEVAVQSADPKTLPIHALNAGETTWLALDIDPTVNPEPDMSNVRSIGLRLDTDLGAQTIDIFGPIMICAPVEYIPVGSRSERITGLGGHGTDRTNLMVHTESNVYEIQSENDNAVVPLPLDEIKSLRSPTNGRAVCHNDVYYYFNLSKYIERYVDGSLENVGPDLDEGLPEERVGTPKTLLSHPSRVLMSVNPVLSGPTIETTDVAGIATVMSRRGGGVHEVYRAPRLRDKSAVNDYKGYYSIDIEHIYFQSSYLGPDRLWISHGGDLLWVPLVPDNPLNHSDFTYLPDGYMITGWFDASFIDIEKTFTHLKIASENLTANTTIKAQYQLDSGVLRDTDTDTHWTDITALFTTSPSQRIELKTTADVTCRRIRFRFIFNTINSAVTPVLKSTNLQLIFFHPIKEVIQLRYRSNDVAVSVDGQANYANTAVLFDATIKTWASPPAHILTLNCMHPSFDGKTVVCQYPGGKPFEADPQGSPEAESLIRDLVLMEV